MTLLTSKFPAGFIFPEHFFLSRAQRDSVVHVPEVAEAEGVRNSEHSLGTEPGSVPCSKTGKKSSVPSLEWLAWIWVFLF